MHLYGPKQLADSIRTVRKNTILIAEDIPKNSTGIGRQPIAGQSPKTLST